jgi:hypothetical protein
MDTKNNNDKVRVVTFLKRVQIDLLDKIGKDALFINGKKLSRSQILYEMVNVLMKSGVPIDEIIKKSGDFAKEFIESIKDKSESLKESEAS